MPLTTAQQAALKADIAADGTLSQLPNDPDSAQAIADAYNAPASPAFYVWRSFVSEAEYVGTAGADVANAGAATVWSWTAYIARSVGEQSAWGRMMMTGGGSGGFGGSGGINPSKSNIRQGIADIFSGSANSAPAQRNHLTVKSKRAATRVEKLLADASAGSGAYATPANLTFEGALLYADVQQARGS